MKKYMPLEGLRWSRDSGSTLCDPPQIGHSRTGWGASLESSDGQDAKSADSKETLQSISQERQTFIKEKLDKWCEELGYKDTTVNMFTLSRSLNISKNELSRYFTSCLNSTFRIWLAGVRFEAAKKMMLDYPDYNNDIISAECGFSSRSYLYRIFKEKEGCSPTVWRAKIQ